MGPNNSKPLAKTKPKTLKGLIRWDEKSKQPSCDNIGIKESVQQITIQLGKNEEKKDSGQNIALKCKRLHSGLITQRAGSTPGYATKRIVSANETIIKLLI